MSLENIKTRIIKAFADEEGNDFPLEDSLIMLCRVGSVSQNTDLPSGAGTSDADIDIRGIVIPPPGHVLGLKAWKGWRWSAEASNGESSLDVEIWPVAKFIELALQGNPSALEWLWLRPTDYLVRKPSWLIIENEKNMFSTKEAGKKFLGMARGQLLKMQYSGKARHQDEHEFKELQQRLEEWGIPLEKVIAGEFKPRIETNMGTAWQADQLRRLGEMIDRYREIYEEKASQDPTKHSLSTAQMGEKRKATVEKHGWDVKNAVHSLRLLLMGEEFLRTGHLRVFRDQDGEMLRAVKRGERSLQEIKKMAEDLFNQAKQAGESSGLPEAADRDKASNILQQIYRAKFRLGEPERPNSRVQSMPGGR